MKFITGLFSKKNANKVEVQGAAKEEKQPGLDLPGLKAMTRTEPSTGQEVELKRKEAYIERPIQALLRTLLETKNKDILPTYDPSYGFKYPVVEPVIEENDPVETEAILERLHNLGILEKTFFETVSSCPNCASASVTLHYRCPKCSSHHINKTNLTEHVPCGNIEERDKYGNADSLPICPKCGKELIKSEYRDVGRWYVCRECKEKFETPDLDVICRKCNRQFPVQNADIREISKYNLNLDLEQEIRQNVTSLESIRKLLVDLGFSVEMPASVIGEKSGIQHYFSLMAKKSGDVDDTIVIDHAVGDSEVSASQLIFYVYKISEVNVTVPIFVAIPKLDETAKRIAQGYNILVVEGIPQHKNQLASLNEEIQKRLSERSVEPARLPEIEKSLEQLIVHKGTTINVWRNAAGKFVKSPLKVEA